MSASYSLPVLLSLVLLAAVLTAFAQPNRAAALVAPKSKAAADEHHSQNDFESGQLTDEEAERRVTELESGMLEAVRALRRMLNAMHQNDDMSDIDLLEHAAEKRSRDARGDKRMKFMRWG